MLKLAIFIGSASDTLLGLTFGPHLYRFRVKFGYGHTRGLLLSFLQQ